MSVIFFRDILFLTQYWLFVNCIDYLWRLTLFSNRRPTSRKTWGTSTKNAKKKKCQTPTPFTCRARTPFAVRQNIGCSTTIPVARPSWWWRTTRTDTTKPISHGVGKTRMFDDGASGAVGKAAGTELWKIVFLRCRVATGARRPTIVTRVAVGERDIAVELSAQCDHDCR